MYVFIISIVLGGVSAEIIREMEKNGASSWQYVGEPSSAANTFAKSTAQQHGKDVTNGAKVHYEEGLVASGALSSSADKSRHVAKRHADASDSRAASTELPASGGSPGQPSLVSADVRSSAPPPHRRLSGNSPTPVHVLSGCDAFGTDWANVSWAGWVSPSAASSGFQSLIFRSTASSGALRIHTFAPGVLSSSVFHFPNSAPPSDLRGHWAAVMPDVLGKAGNTLAVGFPQGVASRTAAQLQASGAPGYIHFYTLEPHSAEGSPTLQASSASVPCSVAACDVQPSSVDQPAGALTSLQGAFGFDGAFSVLQAPTADVPGDVLLAVAARGGLVFLQSPTFSPEDPNLPLPLAQAAHAEVLHCSDLNLELAGGELAHSKVASIRGVEALGSVAPDGTQAFAVWLQIVPDDTTLPVDHTLGELLLGVMTYELPPLWRRRVVVSADTGRPLVRLMHPQVAPGVNMDVWPLRRYILDAPLLLFLGDVNGDGIGDVGIQATPAENSVAVLALTSHGTPTDQTGVNSLLLSSSGASASVHFGAQYGTPHSFFMGLRGGLDPVPTGSIQPFLMWRAPSSPGSNEHCTYTAAVPGTGVPASSVPTELQAAHAGAAVSLHAGNGVPWRSADGSVQVGQFSSQLNFTAGGPVVAGRSWEDGSTSLFMGSPSTVLPYSDLSLGAVYVFRTSVSEHGGLKANAGDSFQALHLGMFSLSCGPAPNSSYGASLAYLGRWSGTGEEALLVGVPDWLLTGMGPVGGFVLLTLKFDEGTFLVSNASHTLIESSRLKNVPLAGGHAGASLTVLGDLNGDGLPEVGYSSAGAPSGICYDAFGVLFPVQGVNATWENPVMNLTGVTVALGAAGDCVHAGAVLTSPGDIDQDGTRDVAVFAPMLGISGGIILAFLSPGATPSVAAWADVLLPVSSTVTAAPVFRTGFPCAQVISSYLSTDGVQSVPGPTIALASTSTLHLLRLVGDRSGLVAGMRRLPMQGLLRDTVQAEYVSIGDTFKVQSSSTRGVFLPLSAAATGAAGGRTAFAAVQAPRAWVANASEQQFAGSRNMGVEAGLRSALELPRLVLVGDPSGPGTALQPIATSVIPQVLTRQFPGRDYFLTAVATNTDLTLLVHAGGSGGHREGELLSQVTLGVGSYQVNYPLAIAAVRQPAWGIASDKLVLLVLGLYDHNIFSISLPAHDPSAPLVVTVEGTVGLNMGSHLQEALVDLGGGNATHSRFALAQSDNGAQYSSNCPASVWIFYMQNDREHMCNYYYCQGSFHDLSFPNGVFDGFSDTCIGLGTSLALAGDVDGNGAMDLAAGLPGHAGAGGVQGAILLLLLTADGDHLLSRLLVTGASPGLAPLALSGGGWTLGHAIGEATATGAPADNPTAYINLLSTSTSSLLLRVQWQEHDGGVATAQVISTAFDPCSSSAVPVSCAGAGMGFSSAALESGDTAAVFLHGDSSSHVHDVTAWVAPGGSVGALPRPGYVQSSGNVSSPLSHSTPAVSLVNTSLGMTPAGGGCGQLTFSTGHVVKMATDAHRSSPLVFLVKPPQTEPAVFVLFTENGTPVNVGLPSGSSVRVHDIAVVQDVTSAQDSVLLLSYGPQGVGEDGDAPYGMCTRMLFEGGGMHGDLDCTAIVDLRSSDADFDDTCGFWETPLAFSAEPLNPRKLMAAFGGKLPGPLRRAVLLGIPSACAQGRQDAGGLALLFFAQQIDNARQLIAMEPVLIGAGQAATTLGTVRGLGASLSVGPDTGAAGMSFIISSLDGGVFVVEVDAAVSAQPSLEITAVYSIPVAAALQPLLYSHPDSLYAPTLGIQSVAQGAYLVAAADDWLGRPGASAVLRISGASNRTTVQVQVAAVLSLAEPREEQGSQCNLTQVVNATAPPPVVWLPPPQSGSRRGRSLQSDTLPHVIALGIGLGAGDLSSLGLSPWPVAATPLPTPALTPTASSSPTGSTTASASHSPSATISPTGTPVSSPSALSSQAAISPSVTPSSQPPGASPTPSSSFVPVQVEVEACESTWWGYCPGIGDRGQGQGGTGGVPGSNSSRGSGSLGGASSQLDLALVPGLWCPGCTSAREALQSADIMLCPRVGACEVGGDKRQLMRCAPGHTGAGCAACQSGWYPDQQSPCLPCKQCQDTPVTALVMMPLLVVLVVGGLGYLSFQAISTRGQIVQDLLFGALRIMGMYASVLSYVIAAFAPAEEGSLGMRTRAIQVDDWYKACDRTTDAHRSAVLGAPEDFRNVTGGAWVSDAPLYPDRPRPDSSGLAFADSVKSVVGTFSGAFSFASTEFVACLAGHDDYRDTVISQLALLCGLFLVMLFFLLVMRCRPSLKEIPAASARGGGASQRRLVGAGGGGSGGGVTANPMLKKTGPQRSIVADLAVTSDKDGLPALSCGQTALWSVTRLVASIYVFVWASTLSASLQMIAPGVRVGDASYITASSLALDAMQNTPLVSIAAVSLAVFGGLLPVYLLVFLTGNASRVLDVHRHESVTVAVLTTGYRLQLTSAETDRLVRQQLAIKRRASAHASATGKTPISSKDSQQDMVLSMAREVSKRMEARCCGLAKYIPSHGFALVRQIQTVLVLCALWLLLDEIARACVIVLALVIAMALTYVLQPYALPELNSLDMQASLAVMLHVIVLVAGGWPLLGIGVWAVHGITVIAITVAVGRGLSQKARAAAKSVNSWIKNALPDLKDVDGDDMDDAGDASAQQLSAQDKEVLQSSSISLVDVARAVFSKIGISRCKRSPEEIEKERRRHVLSGGPNPWLTFTERANRTIDTLVQDAEAGAEPSAMNDAIERFLESATGVQPSIVDIISKPAEPPKAAATSIAAEGHAAGASTVGGMAFATAELGAALARVRAAREAEKAAAEAARATAPMSPRDPRGGTKALKPRRASVGGGPLSPSAAAAAAAARPAGTGMRHTFNKAGVASGPGAGRSAAAALPSFMAAAGAKAARRSSMVGGIGVGMFGAGDSGSDDELHPAGEGGSAVGGGGARAAGRRRSSSAAGRRASLFVPAQGKAAAQERLEQAEDAFAPVRAPDRGSRRMSIASQRAVSGAHGGGGRRSSVAGSRKSLAAAQAAATDPVTTPNPLARPGGSSELGGDSPSAAGGNATSPPVTAGTDSTSGGGGGATLSVPPASSAGKPSVAARMARRRSVSRSGAVAAGMLPLAAEGGLSAKGLPEPLGALNERRKHGQLYTPLEAGVALPELDAGMSGPHNFTIDSPGGEGGGWGVSNTPTPSNAAQAAIGQLVAGSLEVQAGVQGGYGAGSSLAEGANQFHSTSASSVASPRGSGVEEVHGGRAGSSSRHRRGSTTMTPQRLQELRASMPAPGGGDAAGAEKGEGGSAPAGPSQGGGRRSRRMSRARPDRPSTTKRSSTHSKFI